MLTAEMIEEFKGMSERDQIETLSCLKAARVASVFTGLLNSRIADIHRTLAEAASPSVKRAADLFGSDVFDYCATNAPTLDAVQSGPEA